MTTDFRQGLYRQRVPLWWWLSRRSYLMFVLRELTSVAVAWFVVYLLWLVYAVGSGPEAYQSFLEWSARPWMVAINALALALAVFHTVTWFAVTPQAMPSRVRGRRLPAPVIGAALYAAWLAASAFLFWLLVIA
jgi:succinate dehydrogenase subunit C